MTSDESAGISLESYVRNEDPPPHSFHVLLLAILLALVVIAAVALLVQTSILYNDQKYITLTGSSAMSYINLKDAGRFDEYIPTEDYLNNCSNNWTFISCIRNKTGTRCYADGNPIPINGELRSSEEPLTISYWMRYNNSKDDSRELPLGITGQISRFP